MALFILKTQNITFNVIRYVWHKIKHRRETKWKNPCVFHFVSLLYNIFYKVKLNYDKEDNKCYILRSPSGCNA